MFLNKSFRKLWTFVYSLMVHLLVFVKLSFLFNCGILVLLVFGDEIIHVAFSFGEFHFVHALAGVPVKEGLSAEHDGELLGHTFPRLLHSGGVSNEYGGHFKTFGWNVTDGGLHVVRNPLYEVGRILVYNVEHLLIYLLLVFCRYKIHITQVNRDYKEKQNVLSSSELHSRIPWKTFVLGTALRMSNIAHGVGLRRTSCSWHQSIVG